MLTASSQPPLLIMKLQIAIFQRRLNIALVVIVIIIQISSNNQLSKLSQCEIIFSVLEC